MCMLRGGRGGEGGCVGRGGGGEGVCVGRGERGECVTVCACVVCE